MNAGFLGPDLDLRDPQEHRARLFPFDPRDKKTRDILPRVADLSGTAILAVDDDEDTLEWLQVKLGARGVDLTCCRGGGEALAFLSNKSVDMVLTDLGMIGIDGIELCTRAVSMSPDTPVILLTAHGTVEAAQAALRAGAFDFIVKPLRMEPLVFSLERALRHRRLNQEVDRLRLEVDQEARFGDLLGSSPAMRKVFGLLERILDINVTVLIAGESGTGKELVARALHRCGPRRDGPFVAINCAALPEPLLEAELFGHVRGAFTGAQAARTGLIASASGGTLFLDEIAELPLTLQPKLLRALQERKVRPVGADREVSVDTRVVAATNRDLRAAVEDGSFRSDLFFRLNVVPVELPPLRARGRDVLILAQAFVDRFAAEMKKPVIGFGQPVAQRLLSYAWPGNVRELQNAIERAVALASGSQLASEDLPEAIHRYKSVVPGPVSKEGVALLTLDEIERHHILRVLAAVDDSKTEAARVLGISRKTLYRKLASYGWLDEPDAEDRAPPPALALDAPR